MRWSVAVVLVATVAATLTPAAPVAAQATAGPQIVAVYPNPTSDGDRGEFVVLEIPAGTTGNLSLSDGETIVVLPEHRPSGRVAVATEPVARNLTERPVVLVPGSFRLANRGETVTLRLDGRAVHSVTYPRRRRGRSTDWAPTAGDGTGSAPRRFPFGRRRTPGPACSCCPMRRRPPSSPSGPPNAGSGWEPTPSPRPP